MIQSVVFMEFGTCSDVKWFLNCLPGVASRPSAVLHILISKTSLLTAKEHILYTFLMYSYKYLHLTRR
uniref:Macaca fascicularis brain cDNA, clone: QtrA-15456 n=1 Tax=Macaca fascicularis TaxID=9541 RepID=I7GEH8_MACFA|nr:unnamed protein product [Macaca fascicularis]